MAKIKIYSMEQMDSWKKIVRKFKCADVYYSPEYVMSFQKNGDGNPLLLYYESEELQAINVVMVRPVPIPDGSSENELEQYIDFVTPYGYGGFLLQGDTSNEQMALLKQRYEDFCRDHHVVAEFVRFHPVLDNAHQVENLYQVIDLGNTICMDISDEDTIWANLSSKNRNMIRKAQKNGVQVFFGREPQLFEAFDCIYRETMDKVGAADYYYFDKAFYDSLLYDMKQSAVIFYAMYEGQMIAASIILYDGNALQYHLSASKREFLTYAPTNLILYEAACWGSGLGAKKFHLGSGVGARKDSLYSFKKQFNRNEDLVFSIGKKIYNNEVYEKLWQMNNNHKETGFFPAYRA